MPKRPIARPPAPRSRLTPIAAAALLAGAIDLAYLNSFAGQFFFDDNTSLLANPSVRRLWPLWAPLLPPPQVTTAGRPLANLTFAFNYALGGYDVAGYHAVNLLIHIGAALALFGVARRLLYSPALGGRFAGSETLAALLVAGLWALHPLQTEAVTYIVQRVESLMGLFFFLTLYFFIRSVEEPEIGKRKAESGNAKTGKGSKFPLFAFRFPILSVAACLLGTATKEVIALAPVMVLLCDRTFYAGSFGEAWRRRRRLHLALMATWIPLALFVASTGWNRGGSAGFDVGIHPWAYWLTQVEAVARYLRLAVWPHPLVFDYGTFWRTPGQALPYALVVVPLAAATVVALRFRPVEGFLGAWFFGILAPTSVIPGTFQIIVEHRMYLPLAAVTAGAVGACYQLWGRRGLLLLVPAAALLGVLTYRRNAEYRSDIEMWSATEEARPENGRAHNNLGNAYLAEGRLDDAAACYREAIRLAPDAVDAHSNLGGILLRTGRIPEAIRECSLAVALKPRQGALHLLLGDALRAGGRDAEATAEYEQAVRLSPGSVRLRLTLGAMLLEQGRAAEATATMAAAVALDPDDPLAQLGLANALLRTGQSAGAIGHYQHALAFDPANSDALNNLGTALLQQGRLGEAASAFSDAIQVKPDDPLGHNNLGAALARLGRTAEARVQFEAALRLKPDYPDAIRNLDSLEGVNR